MTAFIILGIIAVLAIYAWAIRQRGGGAYILGVAYTAATFLALLLSMFLYEPKEFNIIDFKLEATTMVVSFFAFPLIVLVAVGLCILGIILGSHNIPNNTVSTEINPKKWVLYVLVNGVVVNGTLYAFSSVWKELTGWTFVLSTLLIIAQYPILCKMKRWMKKSLILTGTMLLFFILFLWGSAINNNFDPGGLAVGSIFFAYIVFIGGSPYLMSIIWMNYALRRKLF